MTLLSCSEKQTLIRTEVPARPAGQQDMLQFAAEPIADVGIGVVGLGMRGGDAVERLTFVPGCHVAAVCDVETDRAEKSLAYLKGKGLSANVYSGEEESYKALCEDPSVDLVYICTDWIHHVPVALYAMEHGKHVAIEVPSAETLQACWDLVNTSERTRRHCMILENCCYDFFEMTALTMAQAGVFGEIIHAEGAYLHNLDPFWKHYWSNWRLDFNEQHRGDLYPTHGFGPVCQALDIHRGDRLTTLVAMDTDPFNGPKHVKAMTGRDGSDFRNGDVTMTMLRTQKGKTILVEHDVLTPRPYNRMYQLVGTDGYAGKYPIQHVCLRSEGAENVDYQRSFGRIDGAVSEPDPDARTRGPGQGSGRSRRNGFHHGLPPGLLPEQRSPAGHGRVRSCGVVLRDGALPYLAGERKRTCRGPGFHPGRMGPDPGFPVRFQALIAKYPRFLLSLLFTRIIC